MRLLEWFIEITGLGRYGWARLGMQVGFLFATFSFAGCKDVQILDADVRFSWFGWGRRDGVGWIWDGRAADPRQSSRAEEQGGKTGKQVLQAYRLAGILGAAGVA